MAGPSHEDPAVLALLEAPLAAQAAALSAWGLPPAGVLLLMSACEGRCFFCANPGTTAPPPERSAPWSRIEPFLAENLQVGLRRLWVVGTEPTTHPEVERSLRFAADCGFDELALMTSGQRLRNLDLGLLSLVAAPLYASEAYAHDAVVGVPGSFSAALGGLDAARHAGVTVRVHTLALRRTLVGLAALAGEVRARFGTRLTVAPARAKDGLFDHGREAATLDEVETAVDGLDVGLVGFPDCVAPDAPRDAAPLISLYFRGQARGYAPVCGPCVARSRCPGIVTAELARGTIVRGLR